MSWEELESRDIEGSDEADHITDVENLHDVTEEQLEEAMSVFDNSDKKTKGADQVAVDLDREETGRALLQF